MHVCVCVCGSESVHQVQKIDARKLNTESHSGHRVGVLHAQTHQMIPNEQKRKSINSKTRKYSIKRYIDCRHSAYALLRQSPFTIYFYASRIQFNSINACTRALSTTMHVRSNGLAVRFQQWACSIDGRTSLALRILLNCIQFQRSTESENAILS